MPYKLNEPHRDKIPKAKYRVTNWSEYDRGLVQRRDIRFVGAPDTILSSGMLTLNALLGHGPELFHDTVNEVWYLQWLKKSVMNSAKLRAVQSQHHSVLALLAGRIGSGRVQSIRISRSIIGPRIQPGFKVVSLMRTKF